MTVLAEILALVSAPTKADLGRRAREQRLACEEWLRDVAHASRRFPDLVDPAHVAEMERLVIALKSVEEQAAVRT